MKISIIKLINRDYSNDEVVKECTPNFLKNINFEWSEESNNAHIFAKDIQENTIAVSFRHIDNGEEYAYLFFQVEPWGDSTIYIIKKAYFDEKLNEKSIRIFVSNTLECLFRDNVAHQDYVRTNGCYPFYSFYKEETMANVCDEIIEAKKSKPKATVETLKEYLKLKELVNQQKIEPGVLKELSEQYDWKDEVFEKNGKKGVRSITGEVLVPALYDDYREIYSQLIRIENGVNPHYIASQRGKFGLVAADGTGTSITDFCCDGICYFEDYDKFLFFNPGGYGVMSASGEIIVPCQMDEIIWCPMGSLAFCKDGKWGQYTDQYGYMEPHLDELYVDGVVVRIPQSDSYYLRKYYHRDDPDTAGCFIGHYEGANNDGYWGYFYCLDKDGLFHEGASFGDIYYGSVLGVPITKEQYTLLTDRVKKVTKSIFRYAETHLYVPRFELDTYRYYIKDKHLLKVFENEIEECLILDDWNLRYSDSDRDWHYYKYELDETYRIEEKTYEHCKKRILNFARKQMDLCKSIIDNYDTNRRND